MMVIPSCTRARDAVIVSQQSKRGISSNSSRIADTPLLFGRPGWLEGHARTPTRPWSARHPPSASSR
ncbi:hypothetical protein Pcinc_028151 [Petrolisthes cinctipes]|uniref:Uncharacterized protein n=1 Tax=Petrolisthes cinctipes TaxID=88211 RepID=A0AAE1F481_PETCI|nr:hypothetical protein Pcinc_028151 [Petrolisthes cinctipes]